MLYKVTPIAVVGGSFLPSLAGHNFSEAAAAGCAVLTGNANVSTYLNLDHFLNQNTQSLTSCTGFQGPMLDIFIICWLNCGR